MEDSLWMALWLRFRANPDDFQSEEEQPDSASEDQAAASDSASSSSSSSSSDSDSDSESDSSSGTADSDSESDSESSDTDKSGSAEGLRHFRSHRTLVGVCCRISYHYAMVSFRIQMFKIFKLK